MSIEKRHFKRIPVDIHLVIESLYKQDHELIERVNLDIEIVNVSKSGLGFLSTGEMPLGYYFNARITMDEDKKFFSVIKIIRKQALEDGQILYGCEFVGLADILALSIDEYEKEHDLN